MQTSFSIAQLADPNIAEADKILRNCVHCGFCTATCPTYVTLGNELDSPRGRIYLIKEMLENDRAADAGIVKHIDRCLSCLSCMSTCPSGVHYMHLVDHARAHIEKTYKRPIIDRSIRSMLAMILPYPDRFRLALKAAKFARPFRGLLKTLPGMKPIAAMLELTPAIVHDKQKFTLPGTFKATGDKAGRVAILTGCAQPALDPGINGALIELLQRKNIEVVLPKGEACCGALVHHMGREDDALSAARNNIDAWMDEIDNDGLDAIIITTSGCGTTIKDYGYMLRHDTDYAQKAKKISALAKDATEYLATLDLGEPKLKSDLTIAYHSACSMQHGQKITRQPKELLGKAGFVVKDVPEGHLCCGSAGTYNMMQSEIATTLRDRKVKNIAKTGADIISAGNIGCITQIAGGTKTPIVHTVKLLNWAWGGEKPSELN